MIKILKWKVFSNLSAISVVTGFGTNRQTKTETWPLSIDMDQRRLANDRNIADIFYGYIKNYQYWGYYEKVDRCPSMSIRLPKKGFFLIPIYHRNIIKLQETLELNFFLNVDKLIKMKQLKLISDCYFS